MTEASRESQQASLAAARAAFDARDFERCSTDLLALLRSPSLDGEIAAAARALYARAHAESLRQSDIRAALAELGGAWSRGDSPKMLAELARIPLDYSDPAVRAARAEFAAKLDRLQLARARAAAARSKMEQAEFSTAERELRAALSAGDLPSDTRREIEALLERAAAETRAKRTDEESRLVRQLGSLRQLFDAGRIDDCQRGLEVEYFGRSELAPHLLDAARALRADCDRGQGLLAELASIRKLLADGNSLPALDRLNLLNVAGAPAFAAQEAEVLRSAAEAGCADRAAKRVSGVRRRIDQASAALEEGETRSAAAFLDEIESPDTLPAVIRAEIESLRAELIQQPAILELLEQAEAHVSTNDEHARDLLAQCPERLRTWAARRRLGLGERLAERARAAKEQRDRRATQLFRDLEPALSRGDAKTARTILDSIGSQLDPGGDLADQHSDAVQRLSNVEQWHLRLAKVQSLLEENNLPAAVARAESELSADVVPAFAAASLVGIRDEAQRRIADRRTALAKQLALLAAQVESRGRTFRNLEQRLATICADPLITTEHRRKADEIRSMYAATPAAPVAARSGGGAGAAVLVLAVVALLAGAGWWGWPTIQSWWVSVQSPPTPGSAAPNGAHVPPAPTSLPLSRPESETIVQPLPANRVENQNGAVPVEPPNLPPVANAPSLGNENAIALETERAPGESNEANMPDPPVETAQPAVVTPPMADSLPPAPGPASQPAMPNETPIAPVGFEDAAAAHTAALAAQLAGDVALQLERRHGDAEISIVATSAGQPLIPFEGAQFSAERGVIEPEPGVIVDWFAPQLAALDAARSPDWRFSIDSASPKNLRLLGQARPIASNEAGVALRGRLTAVTDEASGGGVESEFVWRDGDFGVSPTSAGELREYLRVLRAGRTATTLRALETQMGLARGALRTEPADQPRMSVVAAIDDRQSPIAEAQWSDEVLQLQVNEAALFNDWFAALDSSIREPAQVARLRAAWPDLIDPASLGTGAGLSAAHFEIGTLEVGTMSDARPPSWPVVLEVQQTGAFAERVRLEPQIRFRDGRFVWDSSRRADFTRALVAARAATAQTDTQPAAAPVEIAPLVSPEAAAVENAGEAASSEPGLAELRRIAAAKLAGVSNPAAVRNRLAGADVSLGAMTRDLRSRLVPRDKTLRSTYFLEFHEQPEGIAAIAFRLRDDGGAAALVDYQAWLALTSDELRSSATPNAFRGKYAIDERLGGKILGRIFADGKIEADSDGVVRIVVAPVGPLWFTRWEQVRFAPKQLTGTATTDRIATLRDLKPSGTSAPAGGSADRTVARAFELWCVPSLAIESVGVAGFELSSGVDFAGQPLKLTFVAHSSGGALATVSSQPALGGAAEADQWTTWPVSELGSRFWSRGWTGNSWSPTGALGYAICPGGG